VERAGEQPVDFPVETHILVHVDELFVPRVDDENAEFPWEICPYSLSARVSGRNQQLEDIPDDLAVEGPRVVGKS